MKLKIVENPIAIDKNIETMFTSLEKKVKLKFNLAVT